MTSILSSTRTARRSLVIGTRGSRLALWQAEWVQARIREVAPGVTVTLQRIKTSGDKIQDVPLAKVGGKGLFVKEIEEALVRGEIDLAVHSMKDVPTVLLDDLHIVCIPEREDPRDVLISRHGLRFIELPGGSRVGTSSLRRQSQLLRARPDVTVEMLRGNVDTRLRKLQDGAYDAIVLAAAGLRRLQWEGQITEYLSPDVCLPAMGQGALGIESRRDDDFITALLAGLEHRETRTAVTAERAVLERLQGGCQVPIAAHATASEDRVRVKGLVASVTGSRVVSDSIEGAAGEAQRLGLQLGERLLEQGAAEILREIYGQG